MKPDKSINLIACFCYFLLYQIKLNKAKAQANPPTDPPANSPTSSLIMRKSRAGTVVLASVDTAVIPGYNLKLHDLSSCSESLLREFSFFFMCVLGRAQKTHVRSEWRFEQNSPTLKI